MCAQHMPLAQASNGISDVAKELANYFKEKVKPTHDPSISLGWRESIISQIYEILDECSEEGWDGYDAFPITSDTKEAAINFIQSLPDSTLPPEVVPEPDGDIAIEWNLGAGRVFSVSLDDDTLIYTGIFGSSQKRGKERFLDEIPRTVNSIIIQNFLKY